VDYFFPELITVKPLSIISEGTAEINGGCMKMIVAEKHFNVS
jgi:hypothetical protein